MKTLPFSKKMMVLFVVLVLLILMLLGIIFAKALFSPESPQSSPVPVSSPNEQASAFPAVSLPPITSLSAADSENFQKDYERISAHKPLSEADAKIREALLSSLNNETGVLNDVDLFRIQYVKIPDYFMVEIKSKEADAAKKAAEDWFKKQGVSTEGICNLPVVFYLNSEINSEFREKNIEFNEVPDGC